MKHKLDGSHLVLVCEEDLLSTNVESCLQLAKEAFNGAGEADGLIVDLAGVNTVDSQGLNFLVALYQESRSLNWSFSVKGVSSGIKQLFKFVKLSERFGLDNN